MTYSTAIKCSYCETKPEHYPRVVETRDVIKATPPFATCHSCGGEWDGELWSYECKDCHRPVAPGELVGFFVPYLCRPCLDQKVTREKAQGRVCRMCNNAYAMCCC